MNISVKEYKTFVNSLNDEIIDILGDDYTSCWMFAYYIHYIYNLPILNYDPLYEVKQTSKFNLNKNGIYSYFMCHNTEMHHFVLFVDNDDLILISTYGGQEGIIKIKYDKNEFINALNDLIINDNNNIEKYCKLFGIKKVNFKILDLSNLTLSYTFKELNN
jgi:hypothetical protein